MSDDQNYWKMIDRSKKQFDENTNIDSNKILKKSRHKALTTNILISLAVLLMIVTHFNTAYLFLLWKRWP